MKQDNLKRDTLIFYNTIMTNQIIVAQIELESAKKVKQSNPQYN